MKEESFTLKFWDGKAKKRTPEEIAERVAWFNRLSDEIAELQKTDPLPEDFIDYCKGRKWIGAVQSVPLEGTA
jgi:hypothetical protein